MRIFHELTFFQGISAHCYYKDLEHLAKAYTTKNHEMYAYHLDKTYEPDDNTIPLVQDFSDLLL